MANTKEGYVDLYIPLGSHNDEPNKIISVNGKNYVLPKGETSKVPPFVKEEYERSLRAEARLIKRTKALIEQAKKPVEI